MIFYGIENLNKETILNILTFDNKIKQTETGPPPPPDNGGNQQKIGQQPGAGQSGQSGRTSIPLWLLKIFPL